MRTFVLCLLLVAGIAGADELDIDVVGLFKGAVLLDINGNRQMLKEGEKSSEGILVVSADSREAVIEVNGQRMTLNLTSRIGTQFKPPERGTVSIPLNDYGQYRSAGTINGRPVTFLIDTGATIVAMNTTDARRLGVEFGSGEQVRATATAGGMVTSWEVRLDSVQVGDIRVRNVQAAVLEGDFPEEILLGMTFLRNVEIKESSGVMVLRSKL